MIGFLQHLEKFDLILASGSPRRRQLLADLQVPFRVWLLADPIEDYPASLAPEEIAEHIASQKSKAYLQHLKSDQILITADTIVCQGDQIMGKPQTKDEAVRMLSGLSDNVHRVITGICLTSIDQAKVFHVSTIVRFANLLPEDILYYVENYSPFDKAGSYGIQEWIGMIGVTGIEGSYFNVMGLPVQRLYTELKKFTNYN